MVQAKMFTECLRIKVMTLYNAYRKKILQKVSLGGEGGILLSPLPQIELMLLLSINLFF